MARLRVRRGNEILGTVTEFKLAEKLAAGELSEFDLVSTSAEGDDWLLIRDYVAQQDEDADEEQPERPSPPAPAPAAETPATDTGRSSDDSEFRPIWADDEDDGSQDEPSADQHVTYGVPRNQQPASPPSQPSAPDAHAPERPPSSSGSTTAIPTTGGPSDAVFDEVFRELVKWEKKAPAVKPKRRKGTGRSSAEVPAQPARKKKKKRPRPS